MKYIKNAESIKIESKLQDIEILLTDGSVVLAQAKSAQDYTIARDKKEKFKDALISLAKFSSRGDQLVYISNIPDTLDSARDAFNNKIVSYSSCLQGIQTDIDHIIESACNSIRVKIANQQNAEKRSRIERVLKLVEEFDKTKLYLSVITPFWGDDENRYSEISKAIISFLVDDLKLNTDDAVAIKQKLLEHWQLRFQHNSSQPDRTAQKSISKKDFAWPVAVYLTKDSVPQIADCLSFNPTQALTEEVSRLMALSKMVYHERFEFSNKVIQDFTTFRKSQPLGTDNIEKLFISKHGSNYYGEFKIDTDDEKTEYLTKSFVYNLLLNHRNLLKVSAGIGVKK